jgi:hypothetical protein
MFKRSQWQQSNPICSNRMTTEAATATKFAVKLAIHFTQRTDSVCLLKYNTFNNDYMLLLLIFQKIEN